MNAVLPRITGWTRPEAFWVIERLEPILNAHNFRCHVALAGSIAYRGTSNHDLDLIIYPHRNSVWTLDDNRIGVINEVCRQFFKSESIKSCAEQTNSIYEDGRQIYFIQTPKGKTVNLFYL